MRKKIIRSLRASIEWRIFAFVITNIFFWVTTGHFWQAAGLALTLQIILFLAYVIWHLVRNEMHAPLIPSFLNGRSKRRHTS